MYSTCSVFHVFNDSSIKSFGHDLFVFRSDRLVKGNWCFLLQPSASSWRFLTARFGVRIVLVQLADGVPAGMLASWHAGTNFHAKFGGCPKEIFDFPGKDHDRYGSYRWYLDVFRKNYDCSRVVCSMIRSMSKAHMLPDVRCQDFHQAGYQWCQGCDRQENSRSSQANGSRISPKQLKGKRQSEVVSCRYVYNVDRKMERVTQCKPPEFPTRFGASWQSLHRFAEDHLRTCLHQHGSHELDHGGSLWCSRWHLEGEEGIRSQTERSAVQSRLAGETPHYVFLKSLGQVAASLSYTSRNNVAQVPTGFIPSSYKLYCIY